jgi:hypothetical protein
MSVTIGGIPVDDLPDLGAVADSSEIVAEQSGTGVYRASALKTYTNAGMATQAALDAETAARIAADSAASVRTVQGAAAVTLYVSNTIGNDTANNGLSAAAPFATIAKAVATLCDKWIVGNAGFTIHLANTGATYNMATLLRPYVGAGGVGSPATIPTIVGETSAVTVSPASGSAFTVVGTATPWLIKGLTIACPNGQGINADYGSIVYHQGCNFGACPNGSHLVAQWGALLEALVGPYTISGGAQAHASSAHGGKVLCQGNVITLTGTPAFSVSFAAGTGLSEIDFAQATFVGAGTGRSIITDGTSRIVGPTTVLNMGFPGGTALLQAANQNIDVRTQVGDTNYSILPTDRFVVNTSPALTAPRVWTLPLAANVSPGQIIWISDYAGINGANTITVTRQGPDVIAGGVSAVVLSTVGKSVGFASAGAGGWYLLSAG